MKQVGRPQVFSNPDELEGLISGYFDYCDPHISLRFRMLDDGRLIKEQYMTQQIPYTVTGLANYLNTSRRTLLNYERKGEFFHTIVDAKMRIAEFWEIALITQKNVSGIIFNLKNNWGWNKSLSGSSRPEQVTSDLDALETLK